MADRVSEIRTNHRDDTAERPGITRRKLLKTGAQIMGAAPAAAAITAAAGIVAAAGAGAIRIGAEVAKGLEEGSSRETQGKFPHKKIVLGKFGLLKTYDLRKTPQVKSGPDDNSIPWGNIVEVNGVNVQDMDRISIENAPAVEGQNASKTSEATSPWINVQVGIEGPLGVKTIINAYKNWDLAGDSIDRGNYQQQFVGITAINNGIYELADGQKLPASKIGLVSVPQAK